MHVLIEGSRNDRGAHEVVRVNADGDYTAKVPVTGLKAGREYGYKVWFSTSKAGRPGVNAAASTHRPQIRMPRLWSLVGAAIWRGKTSAVMILCSPAVILCSPAIILRPPTMVLRSPASILQFGACRQRIRPCGR